MEFRNYTTSDYEAACDFLIALNRRNRDHIHWNWARFEWMMEHPEFDRSAMHSIGLWTDAGSVVGAAIYDMYFGEAFCGALPGYESLYPEILDYACKELKDDAGLGIAICDGNESEIEAAEKRGFVREQQEETVMSLALDRALSAKLPDGLSLAELDHAADADALEWLFWQGFDHGEDRAEFEKTKRGASRVRKHFNRHLSLAAMTPGGEPVSYCCLWVHPNTDYAYVEPVCTVPAYRGKGAARAVVLEALHRAKTLGAKRAYVISDLEFYEKLGFAKDRHFSFYWKR